MVRHVRPRQASEGLQAIAEEITGVVVDDNDPQISTGPSGMAVVTYCTIGSLPGNRVAARAATPPRRPAGTPQPVDAPTPSSGSTTASDAPRYSGCGASATIAPPDSPASWPRRRRRESRAARPRRQPTPHERSRRCGASLPEGRARIVPRPASARANHRGAVGDAEGDQGGQGHQVRAPCVPRRRAIHRSQPLPSPRA